MKYYLPQGKDIFEKYPRLESIESFSKDSEHCQRYSAITWRAICKCVVYRSDPKSPLAKLPDEQEAKKMAIEKAYLTKDVGRLILKGDIEVSFMNDMIADFLMLIGDYDMLQLMSLRGQMRKILLSSIEDKSDLLTETTKDATHHFTMTKAIKELEWMGQKARELEEKLFGLHKAGSKTNGSVLSFSSMAEGRIKKGIHG